MQDSRYRTGSRPGKDPHALSSGASASFPPSLHLAVEAVAAEPNASSTDVERS
jgi:hypothetical protein